MQILFEIRQSDQYEADGLGGFFYEKCIKG